MNQFSVLFFLLEPVKILYILYIFFEPMRQQKNLNLSNHFLFCHEQVQIIYFGMHFFLTNSNQKNVWIGSNQFFLLLPWTIEIIYFPYIHFNCHFFPMLWTNEWSTNFFFNRFKTFYSARIRFKSLIFFCHGVKWCEHTRHEQKWIFYYLLK